MQILFAECKSAGMDEICLKVVPSNLNAISFYQKLGFISQGRVKDDLKFEGQYIDAEYMVKYLK